MKQAFYFLLFTLMVSCSNSESDSGGPEAVEQGGQSFSIFNKEITAKATSVVGKEYVPAYAFVSIETSQGVQVFDFEKLDVLLKGDSYVTEEVMLDPEPYNLTEFVLVDSDDVVVALVPTETSALSQFSGTSLPFSFTVQSGNSKTATVENIGADGYSFVEFGYNEAELSFPEIEDFFTLTVDDSESLTSKTIVLKSLTGSVYTIDWGDGTVDEYVSNLSDSVEDNELTHAYEVNGVYEIKVSGAMEVIEYLSFNNSVSELNYESHIVSAEIDKLILLKTCEFYSGALTSLDTSKNSALEKLSIENNQITNLNLLNNVRLKNLFARYNRLTEIDVTKNIELEYLSIYGNQISMLDVSNNSKLKILEAEQNNLTSVDLANNPVLKRIDLSDNSISNIDVSQNLKLQKISVGANNLTEIDLSENVILERIDLYENQISTIDLSANLNLRALYIADNLLDNIDLSALSRFERLSIRNNNLTDLDLSNNPLVSHLYIGGNQFTGEKLDEIISGVYDHVILNATNGGYIDYQYNPGTDLIDQTTIAKMNELALDYDWTFNNDIFLTQR